MSRGKVVPDQIYMAKKRYFEALDEKHHKTSKAELNPPRGEKRQGARQGARQGGGCVTIEALLEAVLELLEGLHGNEGVERGQRSGIPFTLKSCCRL